MNNWDNQETKFCNLQHHNLCANTDLHKYRIQTFILQNNRTCEHGFIHITTDVHFTWLYYT